MSQLVISFIFSNLPSQISIFPDDLLFAVVTVICMVCKHSCVLFYKSTAYTMISVDGIIMVSNLCSYVIIDSPIQSG